MSTETGDGCSRVGAAAATHSRLLAWGIGALLLVGVEVCRRMYDGTRLVDTLSLALLDGFTVWLMAQVWLRAREERRQGQRPPRVVLAMAARAAAVLAAYVLLMVVRLSLLGAR